MDIDWRFQSQMALNVLYPNMIGTEQRSHRKHDSQLDASELWHGGFHGMRQIVVNITFATKLLVFVHQEPS